MTSEITTVKPTDNDVKLYNIELDKKGHIKFDTDVAFWGACFPFCCPLLCFYCCEKPNIIDRINAVSSWFDEKGMHYRVEGHKSGCRCYCCDQGAKSSYVPFDRIQDVSITEPAGVECCCIPRTLYTIAIQSASGGNGAEISIVGITDPTKIRKMIFHAKEVGGYYPDGKIPPRAKTAVAGTKPTTSNFAPSESLLRRNNELLERNNYLLSKQVELMERMVSREQKML